MNGVEKGKRVVLHPYVAKKLDKIEELRGNLAAIVEEIETLLYQKRDGILARYSRDIGHLEYDLFCLETTISELRYRISFLQKEINKGKNITANIVAFLDNEVVEKFTNAKEEIERREEELRKSADYFQGTFLSPEETRELKLLYRQLCKMHHPDVNCDKSESRERQWNLLQHAYRNGDLALLKSLAEHAKDSESKLPETPDFLDAEIKRLRFVIENQRNHLANTISSPPFSYEEKLLNPDWVAAKQQELKQEISAAEDRKAQLQTLYDTLISYSGSVH